MTYQPTYPDYGVYPSQLPSPEPDLGEVAVRLGSLSAYRRGGRQFYTDSFLGDSGWFKSIPSGGSINYSTRQVYEGPTALALNGGSLGSAVSLLKIFPQAIDTFGFEVSLCPEWLATYPTSFAFTFYNYDGVNVYSYAVSVRWNLSDVTVSNSSGSSETVIDFPTLPASSIFSWHNLKVTYDLANHRYGWVWFDGYQVYISHISGFLNGSTTHKRLECSLVASNPSGSALTTYVDSLVFTTNETV